MEGFAVTIKKGENTRRYCDFVVNIYKRKKESDV